MDPQPTVAQQRVTVTQLTGGHCAATGKICLLLHTVKLYHGKVIKWAVINYVLSWEKRSQSLLLLFPNPRLTVVFTRRMCQQIFFFPELACGANKHS